MLQNRTLFLLCLCISSALITGKVYADIYRWIDDDGVVNFTQRSPSNVDATLISSSIRSSTDTTQAEASSSPVPQAGDQANQQESRLKLTNEQRETYAAFQQKEAERQEEISRIRASNCKRSRLSLQRLSIPGRIRIRDENGNERNLPDEERTERIAEAQKGIVTNCEADVS